MGADVSYFDSHIEGFEVEGQELRRTVDLADAVGEADLVVLIQPHDDIMKEAPFERAALLLDTRGVLEGPNIERL